MLQFPEKENKNTVLIMYSDSDYWVHIRSYQLIYLLHLYAYVR
jgi:hypothetical protein